MQSRRSVKVSAASIEELHTKFGEFILMATLPLAVSGDDPVITRVMGMYTCM